MRHLPSLWAGLFALSFPIQAHAADRCPVDVEQIISMAFGGKLAPMQQITLMDLPSEFLNPFFVIIKDAQNNVLVMEAQRGAGESGDGEAVFVIPNHPSTPFEGGRVDLIFTDGVMQCNTVSVEVAPLLGTPGTVERVFEATRGSLDILARHAGASWAQLSSAPSGASGGYLKWLQAVIWDFDGQGNSESAVATYRKAKALGTKESEHAIALMEGYLTMSGASLELQERHMNVKDAYNKSQHQQFMFFGPQDVPKNATQGVPISHIIPSSPIPEFSGDYGLKLAQAKPPIRRPIIPPAKPLFKLDGRGAIDAYGLHIKTPEKLASMLEEQLDSESALKPHVAIYRDAAGAVVGGGAAFFNAVPGPLAKGLDVFYSGVGQALFIAGMIDKFQDGLYPKSLADLEVVVNEPRLFTDQDPKSGAILAINVTPVAKGVDLGKLLLETGLQVLPVTDLIGKRAKSFSNLSKGLPTEKGRSAITKEAANYLAKHNKSTAKALSNARLADAARSTRLEMSKPLLFGQGINKMPTTNFNIPPFKYPPVDILKQGFYQINLRESKNKIRLGSFDGTQIPYFAVKDGIEAITAQTMPGKFHNGNTEGSVDIAVNPDMGMRLEPKQKTILPGDEITLVASFKKLSEKDTNLAVDVKFDNFEHKLVRKRGPYTKIIAGEERVAWFIQIKTANTLSAYPFHVTVNRQSDEIIRDTAVVYRGRLTPDVYCIEPEYSEHFMVADEEGKPLAGVVWENIGPGTISSGGVYTAPKNGSGSVEIVGYNKTGHEVGRTKVNLGCKCEWSLNVGGETMEGNKLSVTSMGSGLIANYTILTLDGKEMSVGVTGQGNVMSPQSTGITIQKGADTYGSGLPNLNVNGGYNNDACLTPSTERVMWKLQQEKWLIGRVSGEVSLMQDLISGCNHKMIPYEFEFSANLDGNTDALGKIVQDMADRKIKTSDGTTNDLISGVAKLGLDMSTCYGTDE